MPEPQLLGPLLSRPLESLLLPIGLSPPFRHLQSASVLDTQMFSVRLLINQHANATERRGHLGLKRR